MQLGSATNGGPQVEGDRISFPLDGSISLDEIERRMIEAALQRTRGNVTRAAAVLGISRQTMRYRIEKHAIDTRVSGLA